MRSEYLPHILSLMLCAGAAQTCGAQLLYNNGATLTIKPGASLTVNGSLTNGTSSAISNSGTLNISGNTINNGSIAAPAAGTLRFQGTTAQTLSGTSAVSAKNVEINNAAGVTLSTPLNVDGAMTFTNGLITATNPGAPVVFSAAGTVANTPTDASHVNGYVAKAGTGAFTFPVGDATKYQPVGINLSANSAGITARYFGSNAGGAPFGTGGSSPTPLQFYNGSEYWDLAPAGTATGTVTIYFDGYNNTGVGSTADLRVAHRSGGQWLNEGGSATGTTASGSVTSNSISTFSPFTLGSVSTTSPLPVKLLSFSGKAESASNRLDWQTAAEDAGTTFTVERSSTGTDFERAGALQGKGPNSHYTFYDKASPAAVTYYRLRITESAGATTLSGTVILHRDGGSGQVVVYPVPAQKILTINSAGSALEGTAATILDIQGKVITTVPLQAIQTVDISRWVAGVYTLRLTDGTAIRLIKQ